MNVNCDYNKICQDSNTDKCLNCRNAKKSSYYEKIDNTEKNISLDNDAKELYDIPMDVENNFTMGNHDMRYDGTCPKCKKDISNSLLHYPDPYERCPYCGQRLKWC